MTTTLASAAGFLRIVSVSAILLGGLAAPAQAQKLEVGASLANVNVTLGDDTLTTFGVPTSGFGLLSPGAYIALFATPKIAVEPQFGVMVVSDNGTEYLLNVGLQASYYTSGRDASSPYVFGHAGLIKVSDTDAVNSYGGGIGYRLRLGDRLAVRTDGRFTRFTDGGGNTLSFTVSIGGLFGSK